MAYLMLVITAMMFAAPPPEAPTGYHINSIKAFHYYPESGHVDQRDLISPPPYFVLRNAFIGEGDAESPTSTTLVLVEIVGPHFHSGTEGKVTLKASMDGRVLLNQTLLLREFFSERASVVVPFLVHETTCGNLNLTAHLSSKQFRRESRTEEVIFMCGE